MVVGGAVSSLLGRERSCEGSATVKFWAVESTTECCARLDANGSRSWKQVTQEMGSCELRDNGLDVHMQTGKWGLAWAWQLHAAVACGYVILKHARPLHESASQLIRNID